MFFIKKVALLCFCLIFFNKGCAPPSKIDNEEKFVSVVNIDDTEKIQAEKFIDIHDLGRKITLHSNFNEFLGHIPDGKWKSRVYLARVDELPIGNSYGKLDKWDMALENGLVDGLVRKGLTVAEKLDHISPRDPSEFIGTAPEDAFYMHGLNLNDLFLIENEIKAPNLMTYQIIDFSDKDLAVVVYLRMIDLQSMKVLTSALITVGEEINWLAEGDIQSFNDTYDIVKNIGDFPRALFQKKINMGLLNTDILNISGTYNNEPSKRTMSIENAIITGLIHNEKYKDNDPIIMEKTKGFKLKYHSVYENIVFNTSPLLYEEWSEFIEETNCNMLMMYRHIPGNGLYIKIIDVKNNGRIIYSNAFAFNGKIDEGIIGNHDSVADQFKENVNLSLLKNKKVLIIDGDKQAVESQEYFASQPSFNEMNLIIEEGMMTALVSRKIPTYEKLKTLYLKRPWMYENKIFNLNPLYLDSWSQLKEFGVDMLVVYNNLIPYEKLSPTHPDYKNIALSIRLIDITTGDIVQVSEFTTIN